MSNYPKVLFFINTPAPSADDNRAAAIFGPGVVFRNARYVPEEGALENCDAVAGEVPGRYAKLPKAQPIVELLKATVDAGKPAAVPTGEPANAAEAAAHAEAAEEAAAEKHQEAEAAANAAKAARDKANAMKAAEDAANAKPAAPKTGKPGAVNAPGWKPNA